MSAPSSKPRISIIMPVLNAGKTIEKAIKSVMDQHYENTELIILDGGSTDGTVDIIKRYESSIAYWRSKPDKGPGASVNEGIQKATGELIALLMADDWYEPNTFSAIADASLQYPEFAIMTCGGKIVSVDEKQQYKTQLLYTTQQQLDINFYNVCYAISAICCHFIRKKLYDQIGEWKVTNRQGTNFLSADKEFQFRAIVHGAKNKVINHVGHTYLAHAGSSTFSSAKPNIIKLYKEHIEIAREYLEKPNLTAGQRRLLNYWYRDQVIRLTLRTLLLGQTKEAWILMKKGMRELKLLWFAAFVTTSLVIIGKACKRVVVVK